MLKEFVNKGLAASVLGASVFLTACGGGGGSSSGGSPSTYSGVSGPLDAVQEPLSTQVLSPLGDALSGTPLEGTVSCLDQVVVQDVVDVLDAVLGASTDGIQLAATELTSDLPNLLASLVGASDCSGSGSASGNPLAGTPLADLGSAFDSILGNYGGSADSPLDLAQLADLLEMLSAAIADNVPAEVAEAPVLGGALSTLETALADLAVTLDEVLLQDGYGTSEAVTTTLENLLNNVFINILPVAFIEEQSGQQGLFSAPIQSGVADLTTQLDSALSTVVPPLFEALGTLVDTLNGALSGNLGGGTADPNFGDLSAIMTPLTQLGDLLAAGGSGSGSTGGLTGTPLDLLLAPLADAIETGGVGSCPLSSTPLNPVCGVVDSLLSTLSLNPGTDPVSALLGLVNNLLSSLGLGQS
ncbi:hypothetical protein IB286_03435 [Spongiibacter sp. KMU-158]|uniref:Uncharacterized protein n=1 Tax=Spongiibacter pelagi TaxID=2760804 RepID=A0A927GVM7_9GAMM|nr:hypothetical protein [Spongiibacter pelagi]MBD2858047.1 hypothetical protein [Spongiibacter pelagi]